MSFFFLSFFLSFFFFVLFRNWFSSTKSDEWATVRVFGHAILIPCFLASWHNRVPRRFLHLRLITRKTSSGFVARPTFDPRGRRRNIKGNGSSTPEIPTGIVHGLRMTLRTGYSIASFFFSFSNVSVIDIETIFFISAIYGR